MSAVAQSRTLEIDWGQHDVDPDGRRDWLVAWLVNENGEEGEFVYDGKGGAKTNHAIPPEAVGLKFRWAVATPPELRGTTRRQWTTLRRNYLFAEHPENDINPMDFCP